MTTRNIETLRASIRALSDRATASVLLDVADSAWSWGNNPLPSPVTKATGFRPVATPVQSAGSVAWGDITGKPDTYTPSPHLHQWSDIAGAPDTAVRWPTWDEVKDKPTTFAPSAHTHAWSEITGAPSFGAYLPLAGGTMDNGADIYLNGVYASTQISSSIVLVGDTVRHSFISKDYLEALNDDGRTVQVYGWGITCNEPMSSLTTYDTLLSNTGLQFGKTIFSGTHSGYGVGNVDRNGFSFYDTETQDCRLSATTSTGGNFTLARTNGDYNTFLRSITSDVSIGSTIDLYNADYSAGTAITMRGGASGATTYRDASFGTTGINISTVSPIANGSIALSALGGYLETIEYDLSGNILRSGYYHSDYNSVRYNTQRLRNIANANGAEVESTANSGTQTASDFLFSNYRTSYIGQDFDIRNNKGLLIGGSSAISSARVGSFTGFTSTGGGTITGGKLTLAPAAAGYAIVNFPSASLNPTSPVSGDIWRWGSDAFMSGFSFVSVIGASDTINSGSYNRLVDSPSYTKGWTNQLGASNTLDFWNYASSTWTKRIQFSSAGGIGFFGTAAPTTKPAVTGSRGGNAALASLLTTLAACGILTDSTTA